MNDTVIKGTEFLAEKEAIQIKEMLQQNLKSYWKKDPTVSDNEWLKGIFLTEFPESTKEKCEQEAKEILEAISLFDENLLSCNQASARGVSKEKWLADKLEETGSSMAVGEFAKKLSQFDELLHLKNAEMAEALSRSSDGHVMMSPNLDGNIAEHKIAKTAEMSASLQGKNISVEVLESHTANSVDVRAINHDTGQYQNYQLKFGKDAKATIDLIERGNYNNQRIVVPSEQLEEVQEYFRKKGSSKTITDHIEAWGAKGKSFTKEEMKQLQEKAQQEGVSPEFDYNDYQMKDLAMSIGKNAAVMGLQSAAITTGFQFAKNVFQGESVDADQLTEIAIKTGVDTAIKTVSAGTLQVAIRKGLIRFIPKTTPAGVVANIACVGIENVKILMKIASGELTVTKGLDEMGKVSASMVSGLWSIAIGAAKGTAIATKLAGWIPVVGPAIAVAGGFVGGSVAYLAGSKTGEKIYHTAKKVAKSAKTVAKAAWEGVKSGAKTIGKTIKRGFKKVINYFSN